MTNKDYDDSNWREEMQAYASGPELKLLIDGPKSLAQSWHMGAIYNKWKKMKGYKDPEPPDCQSSFKEWNDGLLKCKYCGLIAPSTKPNPQKWLQKHEMNCARNPNNNKRNGPIGTE